MALNGIDLLLATECGKCIATLRYIRLENGEQNGGIQELSDHVLVTVLCEARLGFEKYKSVCAPEMTTLFRVPDMLGMDGIQGFAEQIR